MVIQAFEYERASGYTHDLSEFFASVRGRVSSPTVQSWLTTLEARRRDAHGTTHASGSRSSGSSDSGSNSGRGSGSGSSAESRNGGTATAATQLSLWPWLSIAFGVGAVTGALLTRRLGGKH